MEEPKVEYNKDLFEHIKAIPFGEHGDYLCNLEVIGQGVTGVTFTASIKPQKQFTQQIVLKEQTKNRFCINEYKALKFLREKMLSGELPGYYIFLYGQFSQGKDNFFILEQADKRLDEYMIENNPSPLQFLQIFYHVANAVKHLETHQFNHGDLWDENILISWKPEQYLFPEASRTFNIKLIDFDAAFKSNSDIKNPNQGGANKFRRRFIIGYDLNRFFDSLIFAYESYLEKKTRHKKRKIAKLKKKGKIISIEDDDSDKEFDSMNVVYPQEILDFMYGLKPTDPNVFADCPRMSGEEVIKRIYEYAEQLKLDLDNTQSILENMNENNIEN